MPVEAIYLPYNHGEALFFALKYKISDPEIYHGYMYAIRKYNHGKFLYTISARKLASEGMKSFK